MVRLPEAIRFVARHPRARPRYTLATREKLGEGAFGFVCRAQHSAGTARVVTVMRSRI